MIANRHIDCGRRVQRLCSCCLWRQDGNTGHHHRQDKYPSHNYKATFTEIHAYTLYNNLFPMLQNASSREPGEGTTRATKARTDCCSMLSVSIGSRFYAKARVACQTAGEKFSRPGRRSKFNDVVYNCRGKSPVSRRSSNPHMPHARVQAERTDTMHPTQSPESTQTTGIAKIPQPKSPMFENGPGSAAPSIWRAILPNFCCAWPGNTVR